MNEEKKIINIARTIVIVFTILLILSSVPFFAPGESLVKPVGACFSLICHQHENASLQVSGNSMLICYRCMAAYIGFIVSGLFITYSSRTRRFLMKKVSIPINSTIWICCWLLIFIDVKLLESTSRQLSTIRRLGTGFLLGVVTLILIIKSAQKIITMKNDRMNP